jgi:hypothetical protein
VNFRERLEEFKRDLTAELNAENRVYLTVRIHTNKHKEEALRVSEILGNKGIAPMEIKVSEKGTTKWLQYENGSIDVNIFFE